MTFRCMPAFQTLGGGADCGASWVSALLLYKTETHARFAGIIALANARERAWPFFRGFVKHLGGAAVIRCSRMMPSFCHVFVFLSSCFSLRIACIGVHVKTCWIYIADKMHGTQRICISTIFAYIHSYFYSINSLSSFSKRCYRLDAYRALVILSRFSPLKYAV